MSETLREAAERQGNESLPCFFFERLCFMFFFYSSIRLARAMSRRQTLRDEKARKMRELTHRVIHFLS